MWSVKTQTTGAIHSTKIPTGPTGKSGPPQMVDPFFRNFSGWTKPFHWVLNRNFRKFWWNGLRPTNYNFPDKIVSSRKVKQSRVIQHLGCVYTNAVSYRYGFTISKPHRNRCGLEVFTRNRFRTVYVLPKSSQTKGIWVRKNLLFCSFQSEM